MAVTITPGQAAFEKWVSLLDRKFPQTWDEQQHKLSVTGKADRRDVAEAAIVQWVYDAKSP